jgi:hypothetical protein
MAIDKGLNPARSNNFNGFIISAYRAIGSPHQNSPSALRPSVLKLVSPFVPTLTVGDK